MHRQPVESQPRTYHGLRLWGGLMALNAARHLTRTIVLAVCAVAAVGAADPSTPARFRSGSLPAIPVQAVSGGQVFVELTVSETGGVVDVRVLRTTPPFSEPFVGAVRSWQFFPAAESGTTDARHPVASKVLVAGVFRPPALLNATLGEPPKDVAPASADTFFPVSVIVPPFPPRAVADGLVLVQAQIDQAGRVRKAQVVRSAPPFDQAALDAARQWTFRPAHQGGPTGTLVYLLFGFRQPVT